MQGLKSLEKYGYNQEKSEINAKILTGKKKGAKNLDLYKDNVPIALGKVLSRVEKGGDRIQPLRNLGLHLHFNIES